MKKYYNKVSMRSRFINFSFKFNDAKKNYYTKENIQKFIDKYQEQKKNYNLYNELGLYKENIDNIEVYSYNGNISNNKGKIILYIHGGSFLEEAISYQIKFAMKIASRSNATLVIPRYKLLPEANYKDMYHDIDILYKNIISNCSDIEFLGDSSGGGFILSYAMYLRNSKKLLPNNILMLSPWLDLSMENPELIESEKLDNLSAIEGNKYCGMLWANGLDVKDSKVSPMYGKFNNLPKLTIMTGSFDILKPDCVKLTKILDDGNIDYNYIEYKNQGHDFGCFPTKEGKLLIEDISNIISE